MHLRSRVLEYVDSIQWSVGLKTAQPYTECFNMAGISSPF